MFAFFFFFFFFVLFWATNLSFDGSQLTISHNQCMFDSGNHMSIFSDIMTLLVSIYRDFVLLISPSTTYSVSI